MSQELYNPAGYNEAPGTSMTLANNFQQLVPVNINNLSNRTVRKMGYRVAKDTLVENGKATVAQGIMGNTLLLGQMADVGAQISPASEGVLRGIVASYAATSMETLAQNYRR